MISEWMKRFLTTVITSRVSDNEPNEKDREPSRQERRPVASRREAESRRKRTRGVVTSEE
ncbi:hypothetical protein K0M31_006462, partial [Melipona bicolor]